MISRFFENDPSEFGLRFHNLHYFYANKETSSKFDHPLKLTIPCKCRPHLVRNLMFPHRNSLSMDLKFGIQSSYAHMEAKESHR